MSTSPTTPTTKTRRRTATWAGPAVSLVLGAALLGCGGDDGDERVAPSTTVDMAAVELEVQCELLKSYIDLESTRAGVGSTIDPATADDLERRRVDALDRMLGTLKEAIPPQVSAAADQLRALPITSAATTESAQQVTTSLDQLTGYFDPKCGTEGGKEPSDETTLPPVTTDSGAGGASTSASTDTTAPATSTSTGG